MPENSAKPLCDLPSIFYPDADGYLYPLDAGLSHPVGQNCYLPLEVDTEYTHPLLSFPRGFSHLSPTLTCQMRAIGLPVGLIFSHPDWRPIARHPMFESGFIAVEYLRALGYEVSIHRQTHSDVDIPTLQIELFAFFAVAELCRIFQGQYRDDILSMCLDVNKRRTGIVQTRRLRTETRIQNRYSTHLRMPWVMTINGWNHGINLVFHDTSAIHGVTGYAGFCENVGFLLPYKDNFTPEEKGDMARMYVERPEDFDNYALGDLYNYEALTRNVNLFNTIYASVGLAQYARPPRLTTGATVRDLFESAVAKIMQDVHPDAKPRDVANAYCKYGTSAHIKKYITSTAAWNAKVDGGRCRNNRPTDTTARGVICDIDIDGCYGEGLRVQLYPVGVPVIIDYPVESEVNDFMTVRQFLATYGKELVPGLWQARVSTPPDYSLKYPQDFLMSWFPPKDIFNLPSAEEFGETEDWWEDDNVGLMKIFTHQVNLALINHDFVQWLDNVASTRQRKELLDNLHVHTAMFYQDCDRVDSPEELRHRHDTHDGRNTCTVKKVRGKTTKISIQQECHAWFGVSMGDVLITKLIQERKKHGKETPLNQLYKLCVNTTYGDMVSGYFTIGNVVVGNNITARARALAWYMEKGLNGYQSITDGCAFDVNRVVYSKAGRRVNGETVVNLHRVEPRTAHVEFRPLDSRAHITVQSYEVDDKEGKKLKGGVNLSAKSQDGVDVCIESLDPKASSQWVNVAAWTHLQSLFPKVDVLHAPSTDVNGNPRIGQFVLEAKGFYDGAVFHASANYIFMLSGEVASIKMRSYNKKPHETTSLSEDVEYPIVSTPYFHPDKSFLTNLFTDAVRVPRQPAYLKQSILKVGDYARHFDHKYEGSDVFPGMTVKRAALLREYSLTQFTYQNIDQYRGWEREANKLRRYYGQCYEMFFLNEDGSLNYQAMVDDIDAKIGKGRRNFWNDGDKRKKHIYRQQSAHPAQECLECTRGRLKSYYSYKGSDTEFDIHDDSEFGE